MFKSINDTLFKTNNFKIVISLFGEDSFSNESKYKRSQIVKLVEGRNPNEKRSIYLDTYGRSILGFCSFSIDNEGLHNKESIYFSQRSFYDLDISLSVCMEWLRSKNFKYLFDINSEGVVKGLGCSPPPYHPAVYKNQSEFIRFFPAVVRDINGINYEGISIRSQKGALAQFTCMEFFTLASATKNYISNLYSNNLQLLSLGLQLTKTK